MSYFYAHNTTVLPESLENIKENSTNLASKQHQG